MGIRIGAKELAVHDVVDDIKDDEVTEAATAVTDPERGSIRTRARNVFLENNIRHLYCTQREGWQEINWTCPFHLTGVVMKRKAYVYEEKVVERC